MKEDEGQAHHPRVDKLGVIALQKVTMEYLGEIGGFYIDRIQSMRA